MFSLPLQKRKDFVVDEQDNEELSGLHMSRILLKEGVPPGIRRQVVGGAWLSSARAIRVLGTGHTVPMVELAKLLETHSYSITILFTTSFHDHPSVDAYNHRISTSNPSISFNHLPHITPTITSTTVSFAANGFDFIKRNTSNVATTLTQISKSTTTIKAFVIDLFCTTAMEAASSLGIPVFYFFTSGAAVLAVLALHSYFPKLHEETNMSFKDMVAVELRVTGNASLKAVNMLQPIFWRGRTLRTGTCYSSARAFQRRVGS
ncbi:Anthocyanidin 5,3-O-glucosyltransferase [Glycine soja]|uniref:Anthocyanidin 5,3-O-glucosyltransferase n=1 Tax=Glycine soja TaxID=3848 RepID=A0A0B2SGT8_GLYSO|nr:Anthocyanidin 5,3-O-glucosyltransferase [Glycine soja]